MATEFQTCPGCESYILSDTYECPQCGHVFDEVRAHANRAARQADDVKDQKMYDSCRSCGEMVRSGLVRCWSCNSFMRPDLEARYQKMTSEPQPIIFSDIPKEKRTEFITRREGQTRGAYGSNVFDAEDTNTAFTLRADEEAEFVLSEQSAPAARAASPAQPQQQPAQPQTAAAPSGTDPQIPTVAQPEPANKTSETQPGDASNAAEPTSPPAAPASDAPGTDLVDIALQDERDTRRRKRDKIKESRRKRILLPCGSCGSWVRVHEEQAGKTLRCRQCKAPVVVPAMKKKGNAAAGQNKKSDQKKISVDWIDDLRLHVVSPTDVVLKDGSLQKSFQYVDAAFHETGVYLIELAAPAKKSLFGKATDGPPPEDEQRERIREHVAASGEFTDLPFGECHSVPTEQAPNIRLVQPVTEAHTSMFAGVPVFGDGWIAAYVPLTLENGQQAFLSLPISVYRRVSHQLQRLFNVNLNAEEHGVPAADETETLTCALSEMPFDSLKNIVYYENDPSYDLEVTGFICGTCGAAVSEAGRAGAKLGGAAGKGIAKAKCPKCSSKMGPGKAYKIAPLLADSDAEKE